MVELGFFNAVGKQQPRYFWFLQVPGILYLYIYPILFNIYQIKLYTMYVYIVITFCVYLIGTPLISSSILASTIKRGDSCWRCHGICYSI